MVEFEGSLWKNWSLKPFEAAWLCCVRVCLWHPPVGSLILGWLSYCFGIWLGQGYILVGVGTYQTDLHRVSILCGVECSMQIQVFMSAASWHRAVAVFFCEIAWPMVSDPLYLGVLFFFFSSKAGKIGGVAAPSRTSCWKPSGLLPGAVHHGIPKRGLLRAACADQLGAEAPVHRLHLCDNRQVIYELCSSGLDWMLLGNPAKIQKYITNQHHNWTSRVRANSIAGLMWKAKCHPLRYTAGQHWRHTCARSDAGSMYSSIVAGTLPWSIGFNFAKVLLNQSVLPLTMLLHEPKLNKKLVGLESTYKAKRDKSYPSNQPQLFLILDTLL